MREIYLLGRRAIIEGLRLPEATIPTLFIPLFFLAVNVGQVSRTFPKSTPFLHGQNYAAFQLPVSLIFAVSTASTGLALVTDIELGYFDKLLLAPIRRTSIVLGRLAADLVRGLVLSALVLSVGFLFGVRIKSGVPGFVLLVLMTALWGVAWAGTSVTIALRTRSTQTTNASFIVFFPMLFLTPNFVPFSGLAQPMRTLARCNPVSYVIEGLRSLILDGFDARKILVALAVIVGVGVLLLWSSLQAMRAAVK